MNEMRGCKPLVPRCKISNTMRVPSLPSPESLGRGSRLGADGPSPPGSDHGRSQVSSKSPSRGTSKQGRGSGAKSLSLLSSPRGRSGPDTRHHAHSPSLPWAARVSPAKASRSDRAGPAGRAFPEPRLPRRLRSPHLRAQLGWKLLQLPQGRPLFRLHPSTKQEPRSHDKARSRL